MLRPKWQKYNKYTLLAVMTPFPIYFCYCFIRVLLHMRTLILPISQNNFYLVSLIFIFISIVSDIILIRHIYHEDVIVYITGWMTLPLLSIILLFIATSFRIMPPLFPAAAFLNSCFILLLTMPATSSITLTALVTLLYFALGLTDFKSYFIIPGMLFIYLHINQMIYEKSLGELNRSFEKARWSASELSRLTQKIAHFGEVEVKTARQGERRRIAREIHDTVGCSLTAIQVQLNALHDMEGNDLHQRIEVLENLTRTTLSETRHLVKEMRNTEFEEKKTDWFKEINSLVVTFSNCTGTRIQVDSYNVMKIPKAIGNCLYHCIQEAITNAYRHGSATFVNIQMRIMEDRDILVMKISDNGKGSKEFVPGSGLTGMKERVTGKGGGLVVGNDSNGDFALYIDLPFKEAVS